MTKDNKLFLSEAYRLLSNLHYNPLPQFWDEDLERVRKALEKAYRENK